MTTNDARCTRVPKSRASTVKAASKKQKLLSTKKLDLNFRQKLVNSYIWSIAFYGAETGTFRKDQKYLESFVNVVLEKAGED